MWSRKARIQSTLLLSVYLTWMYVQSAEGFGISSFGRANTEPPKPATTTVSPARACGKPSDCAGISSSSCVRTHYDSTTRCLCGDNSPPVNGQCEAQTKSLYHICSNSDECNDGLVCATPNITGTPPPHLRMYLTTERHTICQCDAENGFREHEHSCSDADILKTSVFAVIIVSCIRKILVY
ncbi:uncharacterized protein LOC114365003 isoform X4 [Ostrinia furnacalis]|uniref:uncharacterized protein LOC114365003 isoform X4 n=1 Tax=Ostrinia furnacalis TaxID=93504 RepID=UPI00103A7FFF|nr:uncharacterized protein LOC114365003 isoform X4 [Ostrinia furnacalis]